jgi:hypothetical protein
MESGFVEHGDPPQDPVGQSATGEARSGEAFSALFQTKT